MTEKPTAQEEFNKEINKLVDMVELKSYKRSNELLSRLY